jgi:hypothetical protein
MLSLTMKDKADKVTKTAPTFNRWRHKIAENFDEQTCSKY